jgi:hypothetical protein
MPERPLWLHEVEAPRFPGQLVHEDGRVASPTHQLLLPPRRYPWSLFLLETELTTGV